MKKILFVCLGNICRSPTAQGIFDKMIIDKGVAEKFSSDSCGTSEWHVGEPPDKRAIAFASKRGYDLTNYRGRQVDFGDFYEFDLILAMDESNYFDLIHMAPSEMKDKVKLILDYGDAREIFPNETEAMKTALRNLKSVPDPYHGGDEGFERVLDLLENAIEELITSSA